MTKEQKEIGTRVYSGQDVSLAFNFQECNVTTSPMPGELTTFLKLLSTEDQVDTPKDAKGQ